jgi:hypothetical protein
MDAAYPELRLAMEAQLCNQKIFLGLWGPKVSDLIEKIREWSKRLNARERSPHQKGPNTGLFP